jgi:hypothetical protein
VTFSDTKTTSARNADGAEPSQDESVAAFEAQFDDVWGEPLPTPLCGCCRKKVAIERDEAPAPGARGAAGRKYVVVRVFFSCRCRELRDLFPCFMCSRCPDCCKCSVRALEGR